MAAAGWARGSTRALDPAALVLGAALAAVAFVSSGGVDLETNTWTEAALVAVGALLCGAALVLTPRGPMWGVTSLALFAALAGLTVASIGWSVQPSDSWIEANRILSYLATFAGALALARIAPGRGRSLVVGIALAATAVCGYALLVKVLPATLDPNEFLGRLRAPFAYFNAVGLMAALGLPACVWAGAQRDRGGLVRALAAPALVVLLTALVLCFSRGALIAAAVGLGVWFALVPLRLRGAAILALGLAGAAIACAWALATHPITLDRASLASRTEAGHAFGLLLAVLLVFTTIAAVLALYAMDRLILDAAQRRRIGTVLIALVACVPFAGIGVLATSSRGLTGEISHIVDELADPNASGVNDTAGRLTQVSNSRAGYWREGIKVGEHHLLAGAGALGFATASVQYATSANRATHAHSYVIETFADLGLLGLLASFGLLGAWALAARRTLALPDAAPVGVDGRAPPDALSVERAGLLTMLAIVVAFGVHSTIDWTWFIPGVTIPALACAGWLAGRGPLAAAPARGPARPRRLTLAIACGSAVAAAVIAYAIWQPLRSFHAGEAALTALSEGRLADAAADAQTAAARNPLSVEPLWDLATVQATGGHPGKARATLVRAVRLQPSNPATWLQLGEFDLSWDRPRDALAVLRAALYLDPFRQETLSAIADANRAVRAGRPAASLHRHRTSTRKRTR